MFAKLFPIKKRTEISFDGICNLGWGNASKIEGYKCQKWFLIGSDLHNMIEN